MKRGGERRGKPVFISSMKGGIREQECNKRIKISAGKQRKRMKHRGVPSGEGTKKRGVHSRTSSF